MFTKEFSLKVFDISLVIAIVLLLLCYVIKIIPIASYSINQSSVTTNITITHSYPISEDYVPTINLKPKDLLCLQMNIYYEAGVESNKGKLAIAQVTMNRLYNEKYPRTVCGVVYEKHQFSWTTDKKKRNTVPSGPLWEASKNIAHIYLEGARIPRLVNSLHYHRYDVSPSWSYKMELVVQIDDHQFFNN